MAYFECLHELKLICDLMYEKGISGMRFSISETAKYGDITRGPRVVNAKTKAEMKKILKEIQSGKFVKQWVAEYKGGLKNYNALLKAGEKHQIEKTGEYLRNLMPWMPKRNISGVAGSLRWLRDISSIPSSGRRPFRAAPVFIFNAFRPVTKLTLATRKSPLAMAQTEQVAAHLHAAFGCEIELLKIVTTGDARTEWVAGETGRQGAFHQGARRGTAPW